MTETPKRPKSTLRPPGDGEKLPPFCYRDGTRGTVLIDEAAVAEHIIDTLHVVSFNDTLYVYKDGVYRENRNDIEAEITRIVNGAKNHQRVAPIHRDITARLKSTNPYDESPFNTCEGHLPVKNGVVRVNFETGAVELLPHSPKYRFTYRLGVTYDPDADGGRMLEIFSEYVDGDAVSVLYEIPAIGLLQMHVDKPFKRSYLLLAPANAAKTTYLEIISRTLGKENIAAASLQDIATNRFIRGVLEGKIVNAFDEMSDMPLLDISKFKALTGGFRHQIERKGRDAYEGHITCVHVFAANRAPQFPESIDTDDAWWTRWEIVEFTNLFPLKPGWFAENITDAVLSGFFNDIITAMCRIWKHGVFREADPGRVRQAWTLSADFFLKFLESEMVRTVPGEKDTEFEKEQLLWAFRRWAEREKVPMKKIPTTVKMLTAMIFKHRFITAQSGPRNARAYIYKGAWKWKEDSEFNPARKAVEDEETVEEPAHPLAGWF